MIDDLTPLNASKLLLIVAGQYKYLKNYKSALDLSKHPLFKKIKLIPSVIL